ncbi:MAG: hypothetical protein ACM31E_03385 [Fibrobacterota bacterium]|nr:hypothetical protein [Chitinispirillaceae bacterium]
MKIYKMIFTTAVSVVGSVLAMCQGPDVAGNSSQTGSGGITVASVNGVVSGMTSPDARVSMYVADYVVSSNRYMYSDTVLADKTGKFSFDAVDDSYYNLLVVDSVGKMGFIRSIPVYKDTVFDTSLVKLDNAGSVQGVAHNKDGTVLSRALVLVKGAPFFTNADNAGVFRLEPLPSGPLALQVINDQIATFSGVVVDSAEIQVVPDSIVVWDKKK